MGKKEARARIKINKLLEGAGWRFEDSIDGKANIDLETGVRLEDLGDDFENTKNGDEIVFIKDKDIVAKVSGEREVEYQSQAWKLSPLTFKIFEQRGELNTSGAYQGAAYWQNRGKRLKDMPDI